MCQVPMFSQTFSEGRIRSSENANEYLFYLIQVYILYDGKVDGNIRTILMER